MINTGTLMSCFVVCAHALGYSTLCFGAVGILITAKRVAVDNSVLLGELLLYSMCVGLGLALVQL